MLTIAFHRALVIEARGLLLILMLTAGNSIRARGQRFANNDVCLDFESLQQVNEWSKVGTCSANLLEEKNSSDCQRGNRVASAAYQRGPYLAPDWQQDKQWRILVLGGNRQFFQKVYDPSINYWAHLQLPTRPQLRDDHTLTTWCNTNVVLFGGRFLDSAMTYGDTWLFSGETETWQELDFGPWTGGEFPPARYSHTAVAVRQPLSNCSCQESILHGLRWSK